ncbi:hypothetical protein C2G38_2168821 [Gigaspora rosea]|uniref:Uncharacterized protein n=1 Tax=Gigaspora rosea TaxID=44941 RepID=A0A397VZB3_9GLOM|nr:hypothetical protein C2G38_2168821 [Gigaspora rosea]
MTHKELDFIRANFGKYYCFLKIWNNRTINEQDIIKLEKERSILYKQELPRDLWKKIPTFLVCCSDFETTIAAKIKEIYKKNIYINFNLVSEKKIVDSLMNVYFEDLAFSKNVEPARHKNFKSFMKKKVKNSDERQIESCCNMWFKETYNLMINTQYSKD